jgi:hypothetical protein
VSDNDLGKKLIEERELQPFLEEYANVTGITLQLVDRRGERPDFVCDSPTGLVGIELSRVMQKFEGKLDGLDAAILLQEIVYNKEAKRASVGWRYANRTILVLQLIDADIAKVVKYLHVGLMDEISATGFREIWVADYTIMEPYDTVQLLGVKPSEWRGLHPHRFYGNKPYG